MPFWLDKIGGLMMGPVKLYGDTEITWYEHQQLFDFAPEHRHAALPILQKQEEYDEAAEAHTMSVVEEVSASADADAAREAYEAFKVAHAAAAQLDPNAPDAPKVELDAAKALADEAEAKYQAAAEKQKAAKARLDELSAIMEKMPPRVVATA
jgi:hypothetical protein